MFTINTDLSGETTLNHLYAIEKIAGKANTQFKGIALNDGMFDGEINVTLSWESKPTQIKEIIKNVNGYLAENGLLSK